MTPAWFVVSGVGLAVAAASIAAARRDDIPAWEARVFHAVNGLPDALFPLLWLPMQLGNLAVGTLLGLITAWVVGDWAVAVGVVVFAIVLTIGVDWMTRSVADTASGLRVEFPSPASPGG